MSDYARSGMLSIPPFNADELDDLSLFDPSANGLNGARAASGQDFAQAAQTQQLSQARGQIFRYLVGQQGMTPGNAMKIAADPASFLSANPGTLGQEGGDFAAYSAPGLRANGIGPSGPPMLPSATMPGPLPWQPTDNAPFPQTDTANGFPFPTSYRPPSSAPRIPTGRLEDSISVGPPDWQPSSTAMGSTGSALHTPPALGLFNAGAASATRVAFSARKAPAIAGAVAGPGSGTRPPIPSTLPGNASGQADTTQLSHHTRSVIDPRKKAIAVRLGSMMAQAVPDDQILDFMTRSGVDPASTNIQAALDFRRAPGFQKWKRASPHASYPVGASFYAHEVPLPTGADLMNEVAQSAFGAYNIKAGDAIVDGLGPAIIGAIHGGDAERQARLGMEAVTDAHPLAALAGETAGTLNQDGLFEIAPGVATLLKNPVARRSVDGVLGFVNGAAQNPDDPLRGGIDGAVGDMAGGEFGREAFRGIGSAWRKRVPTLDGGPIIMRIDAAGRRIAENPWLSWLTDPDTMGAALGGEAGTHAGAIR
jgi:hypothetical protein